MRGQEVQARQRAAYSPSCSTSSSWLPSSATRPSMTTAMRSASCAVCRRCAIATTVRPVEQRVHRALEVTGGARVDERGRLVEDDRVRVGEDESGQGDLLRPARVSTWWPEPSFVSRPSGSRSTHSRASTARSASRTSSSVEPSRASTTLSRTDPMKTWCSCVTRATSVRSWSSGSEVSSTPPTVTDPVRGPWMPDSSRRGSTCRSRSARRSRGARPCAGRGRCRAARRGRRGRRSAGRCRRARARRSVVAASRSGGTVAMPSRRVVDAMPTCTRSTV